MSSILDVKQKNSQACLITLDFFKAYDRVFLNFLIQVMKKMNFGTLFTSWISMLHEGAMTSFIIAGLTRAIKLLFSIRQGEGGPHSNVTLHYLYRAASYCFGEEDDRLKSCGHREEFRSVL